MVSPAADLHHLPAKTKKPAQAQSRPPSSVAVPGLPTGPAPASRKLGGQTDESPRVTGWSCWVGRGSVSPWPS